MCCLRHKQFLPTSLHRSPSKVDDEYLAAQYRVLEQIGELALLSIVLLRQLKLELVGQLSLVDVGDVPDDRLGLVVAVLSQQPARTLRYQAVSNGDNTQLSRVVTVRSHHIYMVLWQ